MATIRHRTAIKKWQLGTFSWYLIMAIVSFSILAPQPLCQAKPYHYSNEKGSAPILHGFNDSQIVVAFQPGSRI